MTHSQCSCMAHRESTPYLSYPAIIPNYCCVSIFISTNWRWRGHREQRVCVIRPEYPPRAANHQGRTNHNYRVWRVTGVGRWREKPPGKSERCGPRLTTNGRCHHSAVWDTLPVRARRRRRRRSASQDAHSCGVNCARRSLSLSLTSLPTSSWKVCELNSGAAMASACWQLGTCYCEFRHFVVYRNNTKYCLEHVNFVADKVTMRGVVLHYFNMTKRHRISVKTANMNYPSRQSNAKQSHE